MPLRLTPTPPESIKKHGRLHHLHHGVKILCQVAWINTQRRWGCKDRQWVRLGVHCEYCGFIPTDETRARQKAVLERMMGI